MKAVVVAVALVLAWAASAIAGPTCHKGCPCGNACISCSKTCHIDGGTSHPAPGVSTDRRGAWLRATSSALTKQRKKRVALSVGALESQLVIKIAGCDQPILDEVKPQLAADATELGFTVLRCSAGNAEASL